MFTGIANHKSRKYNSITLYVKRPIQILRQCSYTRVLQIFKKKKVKAKQSK